MPITRKELEGISRAFAKVMKDYVARELGPLVERITALEQRPTVKYAGVWDHSRSYAVGEMVTRAGSLWHSNMSQNYAKPGEHPTAWTLCVKKGQDGKDAK